MTTAAYAAVGLRCVRPCDLTQHQIRQQATLQCGSEWDDVMATLVEFYARDLLPKKVKPAARDQRCKVIEFSKDKPIVAGKTAKIRERDEGDPIAASWPGCF
jgi:hypothetical protein